MKRDAESHAAEDKKRRELAEARNTAETARLPAREADRGKQGQAQRVGPRGRGRGHREGQRGQEGGRRRGDQLGHSTSYSTSARRWPSISTASGKAGRPDDRRRGPPPVEREGALRPAQDRARRSKPEDVIDVEFEEKK